MLLKYDAWKLINKFVSTGDSGSKKTMLYETPLWARLCKVMKDNSFCTHESS